MKPRNLVPATFRALFFSFLFLQSSVLSVHAGNPAVSGINAKASFLGGAVEGTGSYGGQGSITVPVLKSFGFQLDGLAGNFDDVDIYTVGGHLFWRDPSLGLLGLISSYTQYDARGDHINGDTFRVGGEGEYFFERITLGVNAGYQGQDVDDGGFGGGDVRFYPTDFLLLAAGVQAGDRTTVANLDAEFLPGFHSLPGMSVFGNFGFGDNDYEQVLFGIRYYFGKRKSLIRRHREDDPRNPSVRDIGPNLREYQQKRDRLIASGQTQPPPPQ